jgi:hypothetical protein
VGSEMCIRDRESDMGNGVIPYNSNNKPQP